ncbi:MAG: hypothetical protein AAGH87_04815 [Pseudomonadota bacterium]
MRALITRFWASDAGHVALTFAAAAMGFAAILTAAVNTSQMVEKRQSLQTLVDETAVALAREISVVAEDKIDLNTLALERLNSRLIVVGEPSLAAGEVTARTLRLAPPPDPMPRGGAPDDTVEISVQTKRAGGFGAGVQALQVSAQAQRLGATNICIIGMDPASRDTIYLTSAGRLTAPNCDIISNSTHRRGLNASGASKISADEIHSAGGAEGQPSNFDPAPTTDSLVMPDPLAAYPEPEVGPCDVTRSQPWPDTGLTLSPGVYCAGLRIDGRRRVTLRPGVYTFLDDLTIVNNARLTGDGVTLHFAGGRSRFDARRGSFVNLSAPTTGPTAGILIFESRAHETGRIHQIETSNARYMVGTIYLPKGTFEVETDAPVSDQSEYTAIVANRMRILGNSNLYLNTDYDKTDVPTPFGIGRIDDGVRLAE